MAHLEQTKFRDGIWSADVVGAGPNPQLTVTLHGQKVEDVTVTPVGPDTAHVKVGIQSHLLSDGVHSFILVDTDDTRIGSFTIIAGQAADDDLRAELDLVKAELELLKKAFRRHLRETI